MNQTPQRALLCLLLMATGLLAPAAATDAPNVIILVADDQGWGDMSLHGGKRVQTPNIDRLFRESRELTTFLTCPVCSPTRAGFLTARHPLRLGAGPNVGGELNLAETTIGDFFQGLGYRTGAFGKWHNGNEPDTPKFRTAFRTAFTHLPNKKFIPGAGANAHGFDRTVVYYGGGPDKFTRKAYGDQLTSWFHDLDYRPDEQGYLADLIVKHATRFIREESGRGKPFFCYVPFDQVHHPLQAKPNLLARVPDHVTDRKQRIHAAQLLSLDDGVGAILKTIDEVGIRENTIVWYFSDNGGLPEGSSLPFRGHKHKTFEGGVHVPASIRWPATGFNGGRFDGMLGHLDVMPTLAGLLEKSLQTARPIDGVDCSDALRNGGDTPVKDYYWAWRDHEVARTSRWKLFQYIGRTELYDMAHDVEESSNVASANPGVVAQLSRRIKSWREDLRIASPLVPPKRNDKPAPRGEVLEITVTQTEKVNPKDSLSVQFTTREHRVQLGDMVEFDLMVPKGDYLRSGFFISPYKNGEPPVFNVRMGLDQFGRLQIPGPATRSGPGKWEHRIVAMGHEAPLLRTFHAVYFHSNRPGNFKIYVDNLRIRRADGRLLPVWENNTHNRIVIPKQLPEAFRNLKIRAVPLTDL
jgi:arylsulfatase A-like enzyme